MDWSDQVVGPIQVYLGIQAQVDIERSESRKQRSQRLRLDLRVETGPQDGNREGEVS